jgi:hypothetical protein
MPWLRLYCLKCLFIHPGNQSGTSWTSAKPSPINNMPATSHTTNIDEVRTDGNVMLWRFLRITICNNYFHSGKVILSKQGWHHSLKQPIENSLISNRKLTGSCEMFTPQNRSWTQKFVHCFSTIPELTLRSHSPSRQTGSAYIPPSLKKNVCKVRRLTLKRDEINHYIFPSGLKSATWVIVPARQ